MFFIMSWAGPVPLSLNKGGNKITDIESFYPSWSMLSLTPLPEDDFQVWFDPCWCQILRHNGFQLKHKRGKVIQALFKEDLIRCFNFLYPILKISWLLIDNRILFCIWQHPGESKKLEELEGGLREHRGHIFQVPWPTCSWKWHPDACQVGNPID